MSVLVVVAWALLIVTTPSDPQIGVSYIFTTAYAMLVLVVIWGATAVLLARVVVVVAGVCTTENTNLS